MASIRLTKFSGLMPAIAPELLPPENAQTAHNCILTDGTIRPQAKFRRIAIKYTTDALGIFYDRRTDNVSFCLSRYPVTLYGEPFQDNIAVGVQPNSVVNMYKGGDGYTPLQAHIDEDGLSGSVSYEQQFLSKKPINRVYAVTRVRKEGPYTAEGPLIALETDPVTTMYEGDLATVSVTVDVGTDKATHVRIYRSMSGLDTGQVVQNDYDTNWFLVAEVPTSVGSFSFTDGESPTGLPLDVNYSSNMHRTFSAPWFFGLSASGWFVAGAPDGDIQVSERYMHHAWPVDNHFHIPHTVKSMAVSGDNIYIGTDEYPYVGALSFGDSPLQGSFVAFEEYMPCVGDTMAATPTGAIYSATKGIVALSREGMKVLTKDLMVGGETFFEKRIVVVSGYDSNSYDIISNYADIGHALYYQGVYYAFISGERVEIT